MVPIGTIIPWYGAAAPVPPGYLMCDGNRFSEKQFPELYALLINANRDLFVDADTARTPDLRGQFIRGFDESRMVDKGTDDRKREFGKIQAGEVGRHAHAVSGTFWVYTGTSTGLGADGPSKSNEHNAKVKTELAGGDETRPTNVAVHFLIRAAR